MKKLLVILLLLFPVHGAWAKVITIECVRTQLSGKPIPSSPIFTFHINTSDEIIRNKNNVIIGMNLKIENHKFSWVDSPVMIDYYREWQPTDGYDYAVTHFSMVTGLMTIEWHNNKNISRSNNHCWLISM